MKLLCIIAVADKQPNGDVLPKVGEPIGWATIDVDETTIPKATEVPDQFLMASVRPIVIGAFQGFCQIRDKQAEEAAAPKVTEPVRRIHLV